MLNLPRMKNGRRRPYAFGKNAIEDFRGLDRRERIAEGAWAEECNLTSDRYPTMAVRQNRGNVETIGNIPTSKFAGVLAATGRERPIILTSDGVVLASTASGYAKLDLLDGDWFAEIWRKRGTFSVTVEDEAKLIALLKTYGAGPLETFYYETRSGAQKWWLGDTGYTTIEMESTCGILITGALQEGCEITVRLHKQPRVSGPRSMINMGAYTVVWPDKKWFNAVKLSAGQTMVLNTDYGSIDRAQELAAGTVTLEMCREDGTVYDDLVVGSVSPTTQEGHWLDTSGDVTVLHEWSVSTSAWVDIPSTYVRIRLDTASCKFSAGDVVQISTATDPTLTGNVTDEAVTALLNSAHLIVRTDSTLLLEDFYVIEGIIPFDSIGVLTPTITLSQTAPDMDFVVEAGNRLWGCFYGVKDGQIINEIYASKLGDFRNWTFFQGLSIDSYTASRGSDGKFTGAAVLDGHPLFFKERCVEKVFPSASGAHQIQTHTLDGIQDGSAQSAVIIDNRLYYKGVGGVYVYTGTQPQLISAALGTDLYTDAFAAAHGKKYYVCMIRHGVRELLCYDTLSGLWHREDDPWLEQSSSLAPYMFAWADALHICLTTGTRSTVQREDAGSDRKGVRWYAETGILGLETPGRKWISRINIRFRAEQGARFRVSAQYDESGHWVALDDLHGGRLMGGVLAVTPRRCDTLRLRLEGTGGIDVSSIAYNIERGSDV